MILSFFTDPGTKIESSTAGGKGRYPAFLTMSSSLSIISIGIGGWLGAFYSASLMVDATPFHFEKAANILSGPLVGGILTHAIVAALGSVPSSFGRVYVAMFTTVPLAFLAVASIVYVFAVLGFRAFYEM